MPAVSQATNQCFLLIVVVAIWWQLNEPKFQVSLNWKQYRHTWYCVFTQQVLCSMLLITTQLTLHCRHRVHFTSTLLNAFQITVSKWQSETGKQTSAPRVVSNPVPRLNLISRINSMKITWLASSLAAHQANQVASSERIQRFLAQTKGTRLSLKQRGAAGECGEWSATWVCSVPPPSLQSDSRFPLGYRRSLSASQPGLSEAPHCYLPTYSTSFL